MQIKITRTFGVIGLIIAAAAVGLRFATLGESGDPGLHEAIRAELVLRLGGRTGMDLNAIENVEDIDANAARNLLARADAAGIQVHSASVSKPLLSIASSEEVVVRVEYSLPQGPREKEYWLFRHSVIAGWRYLRQVTILSYYTNVL